MVAMFLLSIYGRMIAYLPSWCVSLLSALVGRVALLTSLRSRVERGIRRFPGIRDDDVEDLAQKHVRFLVDVFHQLFYLRYHHRPLYRVDEKVRQEGEKYLRDALKGGKGTILVSLHLGNFFWSISYLASAYPTNLLVRGESNPRREAFGAKMRKKFGINTIYSTGAALKIKERLKKGEIVVFVMDQYLLPFFYGPDHPFREIVPRAARIGDAPVIPFYTLHDGKQVTVRFLPPFTEVSSAGLEDMMMQAIKDHPHLWFWWRRLGKVRQGHWRS